MPILIFFLLFFAIFSISIISFSDSALIKKIFLLTANLSSSTVLPTPEKTIFSGLIFALRAFRSSPFETTSAPRPNLPIILSNFKLELDLTEKQIIGSNVLKYLLKFSILFFKLL